MASDAALVAVGRVLSKVLRHEPELVGIRLDSAGWIAVDELASAMNRARRAPGAAKRIRALPPITADLIEAVVTADNKGRFRIEGAGAEARMRAVQGHSVEVDLGYLPAVPPPVLFHGTSRDKLESIARSGLRPMSRHAVHLSPDAETARRVGSRHGSAVVLTVDAAEMHSNGVRFSCADNGTWLVDAVPTQYLRGPGINRGEPKQ